MADWGLLMGYGLFETVRLYEGQPFLLNRHLDRLIVSAKALAFSFCPSAEELARQVEEYICKEGLKNEALRLSLTYGEGIEGKNPQVFLTHRPVPYDVSDYEKGIMTALSSYRKNKFSPIVAHKTFNQLENILALNQHRSAGVKECFFLNTCGHLAEGSKSNLFFVKDGVIFTPAKECGLLPGITRQRVMEIAEQHGIGLKEGCFDLEQLLKCDECFCTNSLMEIMPVVRLDEHVLGNGHPGEITDKLRSFYRC